MSDPSRPRFSDDIAFMRFLPFLRRLGLALGSFLVAFPYFNESMDTIAALAIGLGAALVAFCLPPVSRRRRPPPPTPRGFEVVVPDPPRD
jgi:hypothetical protein